jgi:hypothetical protein
MLCIYEVLSRHGDLPRRVVLDDGNIGDLRDRPDATEIHALSKIAEIVRVERGARVYSRNPPDLLKQCLATSDSMAWACFADDLRCGLVEDAVITAEFETHPEKAARFVTDVVAAAKDVLTSSTIMYCMRRATPHFSVNATEAFAEALHVHAHAFLSAVRRGVCSIPTKHRAGVLEFIGSCLPSMDVVLDATKAQQRRNKDAIPDPDDLRILMACRNFPGSSGEIDELARRIADGMQATWWAKRGVYFAFLARAHHVEDSPAFLQMVEDTLGYAATDASEGQREMVESISAYLASAYPDTIMGKLAFFSRQRV